MDPLSALIVGGFGLMGSGLPSGLSLADSHENRKFQAHQAKLQREWMERMSNTAHQREVDDLKAAGLNPILSAGGSGSSTPSAGGTPVGSTAHIADMSRIALDAYNASVQAEVAESQKLLNSAQAAKIQSETQFNLESLKDRVNQESEKVKNLEETREHMMSNRHLNINKALEMHHKIDAAKESVNLLQKQVRGQELNNLYRQKELSWFNATNSAKISKDFGSAFDSTVGNFIPKSFLKKSIFQLK